SVYDGLNLVAKGGALVNRTDGVIVLSENVGAHEELSQHVLSVNPFDIEATANAMHQAIVMGIEEKRRRNEGAREVVRTNDIARWITSQVQDIRDLAAAPGLRVGSPKFRRLVTSRSPAARAARHGYVAGEDDGDQPSQHPADQRVNEDRHHDGHLELRLLVADRGKEVQERRQEEVRHAVRPSREAGMGIGAEQLQDEPDDEQPV